MFQAKLNALAELLNANNKNECEVAENIGNAETFHPTWKTIKIFMLIEK